MKRFIFLLVLAIALRSVCRAEDTDSIPAIVEAEIKVRVACGFEPTRCLKTKDVSSMEDKGTVDQWTDFDVAFSLRGVPWDSTPKEFIKLVSERIQKRYTSSLIAALSVYRWDETKRAFVFIGNKNLGKAKGFLHEIKEGDYLVFHAIYD